MIENNPKKKQYIQRKLYNEKLLFPSEGTNIVKKIEKQIDFL